MIIADTDVLIDFLQGRQPGAQAVADAIAAGQLSTTTVTAFELLSAARQTHHRFKVISDLFDAAPPLPLDLNSAAKAAEVHRELERSGVSIGMADSLIAGIVLHNGGKLLTRNKRHFERVRDLLVLDPASG